MKHLLLTTIAAVVLVGCGTTQSQEKTPKVEPPSISIHKAASIGDIEAVRQHLAAKKIKALRLPANKRGAQPQGPRYTNYARLKYAKTYLEAVSY